MGNVADVVGLLDFMRCGGECLLDIAFFGDRAFLAVLVRLILFEVFEQFRAGGLRLGDSTKLTV